MTLEIFLMGLMVVSTLTGFVTEAVKSIFAEHNWKYSANTLAGICAFVVASAVGVCYVLFTGMDVTVQVIIANIALVFMSWLCSMVGYDKVMQSLKQFNTIEGRD